MKTYLVAVLCLLLHAMGSSANDGVYWGTGGVLYPMQETRIAIKREFLSFTCRGDSAQVDVLFEFINPDSARKVLVGFQAPSPSGDVPDEICSTPPITDLRVMVDGMLLPWQVKMAECEDCPLTDLGKLEFSNLMSGVFVYLFEVEFKHGLNRIQHSYSYRPGGNVNMEHTYDYILRTGAKWAGAVIGELEVEFDLGNNTRFFVDDIFGSSAEWSIVGVGRLGSGRTGYQGTGQRVVRILNGTLRISAKGLRPTDNIGFNCHRPLTFLDWPEENGPYSLEVYRALQIRSLDLDSEHPLSKKELRFLRNVIHAQHGYVFKDPEVQKTFEQFDWYIPDPNLEWNDRILSPEDRLFVELIKLKEAE